MSHAAATYADYYNTRKHFDDDDDMTGGSSNAFEEPLVPVGNPLANVLPAELSRNIELSRTLAIELESSSSSHLHPASSISDATVILTLDTNVLISCLPLLESLVDACFACSEPLLVFLIPLIVIRELDGLKMSTSITAQAGKKQALPLGTLAKQANKWILKMLEERSGIFRAQRKGETPAQLGHSSSADDLVLDATLYWSLQRPAMVGLVTNDTNLRTLALAHGVPALPIKRNMDVAAFVSQINPNFASILNLTSTHVATQNTPSPIPSSVYTQDIEIEHAFTLTPSTASQFLNTISQTLSTLLPPAIHSHLIAATDEYTTAHLLRSYRTPWTTRTSLEILTKYFSSLEHLWTAPPDSSASRWASPSKSKNNLRLVKASLVDLYIAFGGRGEGKSSYALKRVQDWDRGCWMGFVYDLEVLCDRGNLLAEGGKVVEGWKEIVKGFSR